MVEGRLIPFITVAGLAMADKGAHQGLTDLPETLLEVFREKCVEDWVHGRVRVLEAVRQEDHYHEGVALPAAWRLTDQGNLVEEDCQGLEEDLGGEQEDVQ